MMKTDPTRTNDEDLGAMSVLYLGNEMDGDGRVRFEAALRGDAATQSSLAELRGIDASLRAVADAESPSVGELRRTREASIRLARTQAIALVGKASARRVGSFRQLPRWSMAAAAAVLVVMGVVGWMSSSAPTSLPPKSPVNADVADRTQWYDDWRDYGDLVYAFTPVDVHGADTAATAPDSPDEVDTQVDALNAVTAMSQE